MCDLCGDLPKNREHKKRKEKPQESTVVRVVSKVHYLCLITPSCMVEATNSPCRLNICPRTKPRPLLAEGLSIEYSSQSSKRNGQ